MLTRAVSANLRLPQTPRTPSVAAAHYFDDVFLKRRKSSIVPSEPNRLRRSSTSRSIGNRSDKDEHSNNGDHEHAIDDDTLVTSVARKNSVGAMDAAAMKKRQEADQHVADYVTQQLQHIRTHSTSSTVHDEFEAQLDGA